MLSDDDDQEFEYTAKRDEDPIKCRRRRYRRLQMRRNPLDGAPIPPPPQAAGGNIVGAGANGTMAVPVVGTLSLIGRSRDVEDAVRVEMPLCLPDVCGKMPVHFFGVYDGHGGSYVAALCRDRLHILLAEQLSQLPYNDSQAVNIAGSSSSVPHLTQPLPQLPSARQEAWWRVVLARCFQKMDELVLNTCVCGSFGFVSQCHPNESLFTGSAAVVAVLTEGHIIVANVGDSRAVLCRGGQPIPLSSDQKPDRPDEKARIEAAGGQILYSHGAPRVQGILAMSRAIGDSYLKSVVTSEPEISFTRRQPNDEFLIIASDGLWEKLANDYVCRVARQCLNDSSLPTVVSRPTAVGLPDAPVGSPAYPSQSESTAALLMRLAISKGSKDNISVIVLDLKRCELKL